MERVVAFDVVHESTEDPPAVIEPGSAERVQVGGGGGDGGMTQHASAVETFATPVRKPMLKPAARIAVTAKTPIATDWFFDGYEMVTVVFICFRTSGSGKCC